MCRGTHGAKLSFELTSKRLLSLTINDGLRCANDLRERIEIVHTSEYGNFLRALFPAFRELLLKRLDAYAPLDSVETRFRRVLLEILNRLPNNELLRPYIPELLRVATETLAHDNEDNALTCLRIIFDLHKNFRPALEGEVQPFLDLVHRIYRMLPMSVKQAFFLCASAARPTRIPPTIEAPNTLAVHSIDTQATLISRHHPSPVENKATLVPMRGLDSFKVLTECPLIVMLLFQLYPQYIQENIPQLTPLMMAGLALRIAPTAHRHEHDRYREFVACQVKTLSFLTYLLRGFSELMKPHQEAMSQSVVSLLLVCPGDAVATRKELLVATRHILATEFRRGFYAHINVLLDETVLIGNGRMSQESLRPLAFSTVADLVHHVRSQLNIDQLAHVVMLFSRNLHDAALPLSVQTTSVRLLLNLVDYIFHNINSDESGSSMLICILRAFVAKLETLRWFMGDFVELCGGYPCSESSGVHVTGDTAQQLQKLQLRVRNPYVPAGNRELTNMMSPPVYFSTSFGSAFAKHTTDIKTLLHTLLRGLKTVLWCIVRHRKARNIDKRSKKNDCVAFTKAVLLSPREIKTVSDLFEQGLECCQLFIDTTHPTAQDEKELLDSLAGTVTVLSGQNLRLTIGGKIPQLVKATLKLPQIFAVSQLLLANTVTSATFAEMLLGFLVEHLDDLTISTGVSAPSSDASILLRLFKMIFGSISLFEQNERILHGKIQFLIMNVLRRAVSSDRPIGCLLLLRGLFRSLGTPSSGTATKLKKTHLEIKAIVPIMMKGLDHLRQHVPTTHTAYFLILELCIAVPVHVSSMSAMIPYLLDPLICALRLLGHDLVSLALRTFEYYLDHLGLEHVAALLVAQPVVADSAVDALYLHLRPAPYAHGTLAIRLLGKLGGYNRLCQRKSLADISPRNHIQVDKLPPIINLCASDDLSLSLICAWGHDCGDLLVKHSDKCEKEKLSNDSQFRRIDAKIRKTRSAPSCDFLLPLNGCIHTICDLFQVLIQAGRNWSPGEVLNERQSSIGEVAADRYRNLCFRFVADVLDCLVTRHVPAFDTTPNHPAEATKRQGAQVFSHKYASECANVQFQTLLCSLLCASTDYKLSLLAIPLIDGLCHIFCSLLARAASTECMNYMLRRTDIEARRQLDTRCSGLLSPYTMNQMLLDTLLDSSLRVQRCAVRTLHYLTACALQTETHEPQLRGFCLISDLILRMCSALCSSGLHSRRATCHALHYLIPLLDSTWVEHTGTLIIKSLFCALADHDVESSMQTVNDIVCTLCSAVRSCHSPGIDLSAVVLILLSELCSQRSAKRIGAQCAIVELNLSFGVPRLSSHLFPNGVLQTIATSTLKALDIKSPAKMMIGSLDCITFLLSTQPPAIDFDYALQCVLVNAAINHVYQEDRPHTTHAVCCSKVRQATGWQTYSPSFCSLLAFVSSHLTSEKNLFQTALLRAFHAGLRTVSSSGSVQKEAVCQERLSIKDQITVINFALQSMSHKEPFVCHAAESLLRHSLADVTTFKREVLNAHLDATLNQFDSHDPLDILAKIERLLIIPISHSWPSHQVIELLFTQLDAFSNSLRLSCSESNNLLIRASRKLLLLLSFVQSQEIEPFYVIRRAVEGVIRLDAAFLKLASGHSSSSNSNPHDVFCLFYNILDTPMTPFRKPLACLLSRYSHVAATYFLQRHKLTSKVHVALLCAVLVIPEAAILRCRLASEQGLSLLSEAVFQDTLRAIKARFHIGNSIVKQQRNCCLQSSQTKMTSSMIMDQQKQKQTMHIDSIALYRGINLCEHVEPGSVQRQPGDRAGEVVCLDPTLQYHGICILNNLQHIRPILDMNTPILACLRAAWRAQSFACKKIISRKLLLRRDEEMQVMVHCLLKYLRANQDAGILLDVLTIFTIPGLANLTFLKKYLSNELPHTWTAKNKSAIVFHFLRLLIDRTVQSDIKVLALRFVIIPMMVSKVNKNRTDSSRKLASNIFDAELIALFMRSALGVATYMSRHYNEDLRVELLKLATVLIEHLGFQLVEHRKELIKFAWNHLKSEDSLSKQWAYVNVCRFIATYETPPKIILQVYVALLRTFQPEARDLVKIALDVLLPALQVRLPSPDFVKAIKWTKKIMYEEGHALPQLMHMWQIIIRHPLLFYSYRMQFVPQMVNSLNRLGLPPNCPIENRQLAVALADTIISWELHRVELVARGLKSIPGAHLATPSSIHKSTGNECSLNTAMIELLVNFLVRLALFSSDNKELSVQRLAALCVSLLKVAITLWPKIHVRFSYFEKLLHTSNGRVDSETWISQTYPHSVNVHLYSTQLLSTCLDIFLATLQGNNSFFVDNVTRAQQFVFPCFAVSNHDVQLKLHRVLTLIDALHPTAEAYPNSPLFNFYHNLQFTMEHVLHIAQATWRFPNKILAEGSALDGSKKMIIYPTLSLLEKMCERTDHITSYGNLLMQLAQQLAVYHIFNQQRHLVQAHPVATPSMSFLAAGVLPCQWNNTKCLEQMSDDKLIGATVEMLNVCVQLIGKGLQSHLCLEVRRPFIALLFGCLERSKSLVLLSSASGFVSKWITMTYSPLTQQERAAFVDMLGAMDQIDDIDAQPLISHLLVIMQRLHEPRAPLQRTSKTFSVVTCEPSLGPFAAGLLAPHAAIRSEFRRRFMSGSVDCAGTKLVQLLRADWTPLSARFWLVVIVEVLLESVDLATVKLTAKTAKLGMSEFGLSLDAQTRSAHLRRNLASIISILKEIVHVHLGLARNIFEVLAAAACIDAFAHGGGCAIQAALAQQFMKSDYTVSLNIPYSLPGGCSPHTILPARAITHGEFCLDAFEYSSPAPMPSSLQSNVPQVLFFLARSLALLSKFTPRLLFQLASKYNCRHDIITFAEDSVLKATAGAEEPSAPVGSLRLLLAILEELSEQDLSAGAMCSFSQAKASYLGARLQRYGCIEEAQGVYFDAMENGIQPSPTQRPSPTQTNKESSATLVLEYCETEWLRCAQELAQWNILGKVSDVCGHLGKHEYMWPSSGQKMLLAMDSMWKTPLSSSARSMSCSKPPHAVRIGVWLPLSSPHERLHQIRLAVLERRFSEIDLLCSYCIADALAVWGTLPSPSMEFSSHLKLLELFHELIEVHESGQLLHEALEHARSRTRPDIRVLVQTWRNRLPNLWDTMIAWDNILTWREFCFAFIRREFEPCCPGQLVPLLHDSPWIAATLMRVTRKHRLDYSLNLPQLDIVGHLARRTDVDDAFVKLREHILYCTPFSVDGRARHGLRLIENASLAALSSRQSAELFRLKGIFLGSLGQSKKAHAAFSSATTACSSHGRAWLAWAAFCELQHSNSKDEKSREMLCLYSVACYLAAVEHGNGRANVCGIARILCFLQLNPQKRRLATLVRDQIDNLSSWVWVPWIHQLLSGLVRNKAVACKCLIKIAASYPQALYYVLRAELQSPWKDGIVDKVFYSSMKLICHHIRAINCLLYFQMEVFSDELISHFQLKPHEKLNLSINAILHGCYDSFEPLNAPIPRFFLARVGAACISYKNAVEHADPYHMLSRKFLLSVKGDSLGSTESINIRSFMHRLVRWKYAVRKLLANGCFSIPVATILRSRICNANIAIEVPGQHACRFTEPNPGTMFSVFDVGPYLDAEKCDHSAAKHIYFFVHGGQRISFLSRATHRLAFRSCEAIAQFFAMVDYTLAHSTIAQRRRLRIAQTLVFPAGSSLYFANDRRSSSTLCGINELRCNHLNIDMEAPFVCARQHTVHSISKNGELSREKIRTGRLAAYYEVCTTSRLETDSVSRYFGASLLTAEALWKFRHGIAKSLGAHSYMFYLLSMGGFRFHDVKLCPNTARVSTTQFQSKKSPTTRSEMRVAEVPFRLTRHLLSLVRPIMIDGGFTVAIGLTAAAVHGSASEAGGVMVPYCKLLFRNDESLVERILSQVQSIAPEIGSRPDTNLTKLIDSAGNPFVVSQMKPTWQPWL